MAPFVMLMQNVKIYLVHTGVLVTQDTKGLVLPLQRYQKQVSCIFQNFDACHLNFTISMKRSRYNDFEFKEALNTLK